MARRALLVGVNRYPDPAHALNGCINDVRQVSALLQGGFGFDPDRDIRVLIDEQATKTRIMNRLEWLLGAAEAGDVLVFHFSGHGSQVRDRDGDELDDNLDEIVCPYDHDWDDPFTDDDLCHAVSGLPPGVSLTVVLDCCHSGTGLRDPYGAGSPNRARCIGRPASVRYVPGRAMRVRRFGASAATSGALLVAACRADQVSADAWIEGDYHGALTYYLCRAIDEAGCTISYGKALARTRRLLRDHRFAQVPQLEGPVLLTERPVFAPLGAAVTG